MPLIKSAMANAVGKNIEREEAAGKPRKQAVAIALDVERRTGEQKRHQRLDRWANGKRKSP